MTTMTGPCTWTVSYEACEQSRVEALSPAQRARFESMATAYLWNWTRRQFGVCAVVARPCLAACDSTAPSFFGNGPVTGGIAGVGSPFSPLLVNGAWYTLRCGSCVGACSCEDGTRELVLPGPVESVTQVRLDGATLTAGVDYRVEGQRLVRVGARWPVCQDMDADPATDLNTFEVRYNLGVPVPVGGQVAAGILALEFSKAACGDKECQLPKRMQNITRQGVSVTLLDNFDTLERGQTGIWMVDSWVASVTKPVNVVSRVYSPDVPRSRTRTRLA